MSTNQKVPKSRCEPFGTTRGGTRNETRVTGFGGAESPILDPENTGAIVVFAFRRSENQDDVAICDVWICRNELEEDFIELHVGDVQPGEWQIWSSGRPMVFAAAKSTGGCWLKPEKIPPEWLTTFPSGQQIIDKAVAASPPLQHDMDKRMLTRRHCEFQIFRSIEEAYELPVIKAGFDSIDSFVARAQSILQRRKSRSGRSLELHARAIFVEEGLTEDEHFDFQPRVEGGKAPDYLFPTAAKYNDSSFPAENLRMLAVKTTCRDRWRQVLNEADRIKAKHLLTLQEGVSENQFREMTEANVKLVVPAGLHSHYPASIRPHLISFNSFVAEIRSLYL